MSLSLKDRKRASSSRRQIAINYVKDGILVMPKSHYASVLEVSALNFELKSEDEQDALIEIYESFLNAVGGPLQILIRTREVDLDKYLSNLNYSLADEVEEVYRQQLVNYDSFIRSLIIANKILTRHFYVIIPCTHRWQNDFELISEQMNIAVDIVAKGLARLGIRATRLTSLEILDLFYSFYSPELAKLQPLDESALEITNTDYVRVGGPG